MLSDFAFASITLLIRSPETEPGQIALTRILNFPSSIANDLVTPIIAHLDAAYGVLNGNPKIPAVEDKLTIDPPSFFFKSGIACFVK